MEFQTPMFVQESTAAQNEIELQEKETNKEIIKNNSNDKDDGTSSVDSYAVETTEEKKEKEIQARVRQLRKIKLLNTFNCTAFNS